MISLNRVAKSLLMNDKEDFIQEFIIDRLKLNTHAIHNKMKLTEVLIDCLDSIHEYIPEVTGSFDFELDKEILNLKLFSDIHDVGDFLFHEFNINMREVYE